MPVTDEEQVYFGNSLILMKECPMEAGKGKAMEELETIVITFEDNEEVEFYVLEQTQLMGKNYYLVAPAEDTDAEEGECYILKEDADAQDEEYGMYEFVEDEKELQILFPIFEELLEDSDTEVEF